MSLRNVLSLIGVKASDTEDDEEAKKKASEEEEAKKKAAEEDDEEAKKKAAAEDGDEKDPEEEDEAKASATRTAERGRIGAILATAGDVDLPPRLATALQLALTTDLTAAQVKPIVAALPAKVGGRLGLSDAMSAQPRIDIGSGGSKGSENEDAVAKRIAGYASR